MSLHFILDGYNIVKQAFSHNNASLRGERQSLLEFIKKYNPQGSARNRITIVFDGKEEFGREEGDACIRIVFSKGESADSYILRAVEKSANPKNLVVITDDRELKFSARRAGAGIASVAEFLSKAKIAPHKISDDSKELSFYLSHRITSELKKIWLQKDK